MDFFCRDLSGPGVLQLVSCGSFYPGSSFFYLDGFPTGAFILKACPISFYA